MSSQNLVASVKKTSVIARLSVTVDEVLPSSKHRFDLQPETRQIHKYFPVLYTVAKLWVLLLLNINTLSWAVEIFAAFQSK